MIDKIARKALDKTFCFTKEDYEDVVTLSCAAEAISESITSNTIRLFIYLILDIIVITLFNLTYHHVVALTLAIVGCLICLVHLYIIIGLKSMLKILYDKITELLLHKEG